MNYYEALSVSDINNVTITYRNLGLVHGKLLDISLGGACVDNGSVTIPVNVGVSMSFSVNLSDGPVQCQAHAIVVRNQGSKCCLMFDGMDSATHQALRSLVGDFYPLPGTSRQRHNANC